MINKELVELQRGCSASCAVILNDDSKELENTFIMNANVSDNDLFNVPLGNPLFKNELDKKREEEISYLVISEIDKIDSNMQNRYVGLVKDREFMGYHLPENSVVVFTISDKENLKKISSELYHFCVVAF